MRILLVVFIAACQQASADQVALPTPGPRNFVCERVSLGNPTAKCTAELSGVGDLSTHTARVEIGKDTLACAINSQQVAVVCGPLFVVPQPAPQPAPPKAEKK